MCIIVAVHQHVTGQVGIDGLITHRRDLIRPDRAAGIADVLGIPGEVTIIRIGIYVALIIVAIYIGEGKVISRVLNN